MAGRPSILADCRCFQRVSASIDVGNKSAVFPLQLLGFDVDVVNSVHFSNHTGYENGFRGDILKGDQLRDILQGLEDNDLLADIGHCLTGYIGSESFLEAVIEMVETLRRYGNIRYVCDPVLGDKGRFYVPESLVDVYRQKVIPLADVLTPNQFELEQLSGISVKSNDDAIRACNKLHGMGPSLVFITSVVLEAENECSTETTPTMAILASKRETSSGSETETKVWRIDCPMLPGQFTGTGDLCAALLLAHTALGPNSIPRAMEMVINTMYAVIERTHESARDTVQSRELKLVQSKAFIEDPPQRFKARRL